MSPGMLIAFYLLHGDVLRPAFVLLSAALNILIYSAAVWLFVKVQRFIFRLGVSRRTDDVPKISSRDTTHTL